MNINLKFFLWLTVLFHFCALSLEANTDNGPYPIKKGGKCGYINKQGRIVIQPQFDICNDFSEGLAAVVISRRMGFIDAIGKMAINPQFRQYGYTEYSGKTVGFSEGLAKVSTESGYGYIDKTGRMVINPRFSNADDFSGGLARVDTIGTSYFFIDKSGNVAFQGNDLLRLDGTFKETLAKVALLGTRPNGSGFVDKSGKTIFRGNYVNAGDFSEGLAWFAIENPPGHLPHKCGYVEKSGQQIIPAQFSMCSDFSEGLAAVDSGGKWGFIDRKGKMVIRPQFDGISLDLGGFSEGLAAVYVGTFSNLKFGYIDLKGKFVVNPQFDIAFPFRSGIAKVLILKTESGKYLTGYIDMAGKYVWRPSA